MQKFSTLWYHFSITTKSTCTSNVDMKTQRVLQAKHASDDSVTWGVDGIKGTITDMKDLGVWEPLSVKLQTYKTAIEV